MTTNPKTYTDPTQAPRGSDGGPPDAWIWPPDDDVDGPVATVSHPNNTLLGKPAVPVEAIPLYTPDRTPCSECDGLRAKLDEYESSLAYVQRRNQAKRRSIVKLRTELEAAQTAVALAALKVEQAEAERDEALAGLKTCRARRSELAQSQRESMTTIGSLRAEVHELREAVRCDNAKAT